MAIFQTEYLESHQLAQQVHTTKKLVFGLLFMVPGVPGATIGRFWSYIACKNDFFALFTTVFDLLLKY